MSTSRLFVAAMAIGLLTACGESDTRDDSDQECPDGVACVPCPQGHTCFRKDTGGSSFEDTGGSPSEDTGESPDTHTTDDTTGSQDVGNDTSTTDTSDSSDTDDQCPALPDPPGDTVVDLGDEGLSDGDEIDPYLENHLDAGTEVHIPAGTYEWNGDGFGGDLSDRSVVGDGDVYFDTGGGHTFSVDFKADGAFEIRNVTVRGKAGPDGNMEFVATSENGKVVARNFNQPDGSVDGRRQGIYVDRETARGEMWFIDCHIEGFSDNGLYASSPGYEDRGGGGEIHVRRGLYKNNNIAGVRIGSDNSSIVGTVIVNTEAVASEKDDPPNLRGIYIRAPGDDIRIENVDITQMASGSGPVVFNLDNPGGSGTIVDTRIRNDLDTEAIDVISSAGQWTGEHVDITGDGDLSVDNIDITDLCQGDDCDSPRTTARSRCP